MSLLNDVTYNSYVYIYVWFLLYILGCCSSRGDYIEINDSFPPQPITSLDGENIDIKCGYCYNDVKKYIFHFIAICLLGVPYLAIHWSTNLKLFLLMSRCPLSTADIVLVTVSIKITL